MIKRFRRASLFFAALLAASAMKATAAPYISAMNGMVQVKSAGYTSWEVVDKVPRNLASNDSVRTGSSSKATLVFDDGSRIELGDNGSFTLERTEASHTSIFQTLGRLRALVEKIAQRQFVVRTPTAVCSVRGTEFEVSVGADGNTEVVHHSGLLLVEDKLGNKAFMSSPSHLSVSHSGITGSPSALPTRVQTQKSAFREQMRREMGLDLTREQIQSMAAREIKLAEFQQGKALIDVFGQRVRLQEYILRPQPNQFKLVILDERPHRFDYFWYLGTFNTTLPGDLRVAMRQLVGTVDVSPAYYLTSYQTGRGNLTDTINEFATGGHPVDVNNNGVPADAVAFVFNPTTNHYDNVTGHSVFQTLFDNYGFYINGNLKYGWTGSSIQSYSKVTNATDHDPITGAALPAALPVRSVLTEFPNPGSVEQKITEVYGDGTTTKWDNFIIDDKGNVASMSAFSPNSQTTYRQQILNFNYEQVITASEFQGRKIDLVVEPKIFVQAGLIQ